MTRGRFPSSISARRSSNRVRAAVVSQSTISSSSFSSTSSTGIVSRPARRSEKAARAGSISAGWLMSVRAWASTRAVTWESSHCEDQFGEIVLAQELLALLIDDGALPVDDIVEFDHVLADVEIVAFDAGLGRFDGAGDDSIFDWDVVFHAQAVHDAGDLVGMEATHELIFEGDEKAGVAGVTLASGAAPELIIDAAGIVPFGADHVKPADAGDAFAQLDVGAASGHVGGDGDGAGFPGERDYFGLLSVVFGIQDLVVDAGAAQEAAEVLGAFD